MSRGIDRFNSSVGPGYPLWVSDAKKRANSYQLAKDFMDYFDYSNTVNEEKCLRIQENMDLHSGRWPQIQDINPHLSIELGGENVVLGAGNLNHYPVIDRVSKSVVSDLIMRPLIPVIRDYSSKARSSRDKMRVDRARNHLQTKVIQPEIQRITAQYDQQNGVQDAFSLSIEEQQQREADISRRVQGSIPEIMDAVEQTNTYDELIADALLGHSLRYTKAKSQFDIGAEYAVVSGEEYYKLDHSNGMPLFEALNPKWVTWGGSEKIEFVEDGQFAKYEQYLTPEDATTRYSKDLSKADIKRLSNLYSEIPGYSYDRDREQASRGIERKIVDTLANNPKLEESLNVRSREGQEVLKGLYGALGHRSRTGYGIRESYITWRWMRRVKFVTRMVDGKPEVFIRDEHYRKDPFAGDLKVEDKVVPQTWSGKKLGDEFYVDVKPIPFQYNNINDPFNVKLGIHGATYNTIQNNVRNTSIIDLGKPWQYKYNVLNMRMEEHQATDIGKVFLGTTTMKPASWTWAQWYKSLFVARSAIVSNHREGMNNLDATFFRSIDLSRTSDIESDIRQLQYFENKILTAMNYSQQKVGDISQYATNSNTQAAISGVDRQMYRFFNRNREIKERVLNSMMHQALHIYQDNEDVKSAVLDDYLRAHYEVNFNTTDFPNFNLHVVDDFKESEKLQELKNLALTFLQNGMTGKDLIAIIDGDSITEIKKVIDDIERQKEKAQQQQFQQEEALLEKQRESAEQQLKLQQDFKRLSDERANQVKLRIAELNSEFMRKAADVDEDRVNDALQRTIAEIESKERLAERKFQHEKELKSMELKSKKE